MTKEKKGKFYRLHKEGQQAMEEFGTIEMKKKIGHYPGKSDLKYP